MLAQIINAILGLWIMSSPAFLGYSTTGADNNHIFGPIIVTFAVISWWEATRVVRLYNLPIALWLAISPVFLNLGSADAVWNNIILGILVFILSIFKGKVEGNFGGGWSAAWKENTEHHRAAKEIDRELNKDK